MKTYKFVKVSVIACLLALVAAAAMGQMPPLKPSTSEILNSQHIQMLQAELMRLRVEMVACHDELEQARRQLELCEKGTKALEEVKKDPTGTPNPEPPK